jgi:hypothetical protein
MMNALLILSWVALIGASWQGSLYVLKKCDLL